MTGFELRDVLSLIQGPEFPPDHWRTCRPFTRLRQIGVNARWAWGDDKQHIRTSPDETVLVMPRQTGQDEETIDRWFAERRPAVRAIVFEADDDIWTDTMLEHLQSSDFMQMKSAEEILHGAKIARYFLSKCDGATVSSEPLAVLARQYTDKPVIVLPNAIDVRWFRSHMAHRPGWSDYVTIGWSGGRRPERDLAPMAQGWGRIARRYPQVRFVVCAAVVPDVIYRFVEDDTRIIRFDWMSLHDYPMVYQVSIGCTSVADTPFSRAKTPIKLYEFATAGAAVVGTKVLYGDCLADGGYTVETADDWDAALSRLIERPAERAEVAYRMRDHVDREHSLDTQLCRWKYAYQDIVNSMAGVMA